MTAKNRNRPVTIDKTDDSILIFAGNALLWKAKTNNEYTLLPGRQGKAIWLTAEELADVAQTIAAMTKEQDGEL